MSKFDQIVDEKLSFGIYQIRVLAFAFLSNMLCGCTQFSIFLAAPMIARDLFLDSLHTSEIMTIPSVSVLLGSLLIGYLADVFGRPQVISGIDLLALSSICALYFANSFTVIIVCFIGIALFNPSRAIVLFPYVGETVPSRHRGKVQTLVQGVAGIGRLLGAFIALLALNPYEYNNWKIPFFVVGFIMTCAFVPLFFFMKPSLHQQFKASKFTEMMQTFREIQEINLGEAGKDPALLPRSSELEQARNTELSVAKDESKVAQLLFYGNFWKTASFAILRSCLAIVYSGDLAGAPHLLGTNSKAIGLILLFLSGELSGTIACFFLIDKLGRRKTLLLSILIELFTLFLQLFSPPLYYPVLMFFRRAVVKSGFTAMEILTGETFEANLRSTAFGLTATIDGICVSISNLYLLRLFNLGPNYLFGYWFTIITIALLVTLFMPQKRKDEPIKAPHF